MAGHYSWRSSPWPQRQLASFQLPHLYGLWRLSRGEPVDDAAYIGMLSASSLLIGAFHFLAIARGDSAGRPNWLSGASSVGFGLLGLRIAQSEASR